MKFPRTLVKVGDKGCLAVVGTRKDHRAEPLLTYRPSIQIANEVWVAARLSYHLNVAPIPRAPAAKDEGLVLHHCDNHWCVNAEHLYLGTSTDNMRDTLARNPVWHEKMALIAAARVGTTQSAETRARIGDAHRGKIYGAETRAKMSASHAGKKRGPLSAETKAKMSAALSGKKRKPYKRRATLLDPTLGLPKP